MQKMIALALVLASPLSRASVEPVLAEKIKHLTKSVVAQERKLAASNSKESWVMELAGTRLDNMLLRLNTMSSALEYYSRMKRKLTIDVMDKITPEVARACCPLNPGALQGQRWYFKGKGNKLKGKGISGVRKKDKKDGKGKGKGKGKGRKRGRGKNREGGGGESAQTLYISPYVI